jgi:hypothetical protein
VVNIPELLINGQVQGKDDIVRSSLFFNVVMAVGGDNVVHPLDSGPIIHNSKFEVYVLGEIPISK